MQTWPSADAANLLIATKSCSSNTDNYPRETFGRRGRLTAGAATCLLLAVELFIIWPLVACKMNAAQSVELAPRRSNTRRWRRGVEECPPWRRVGRARISYRLSEPASQPVGRSFVRLLGLPLLLRSFACADYANTPRERQKLAVKVNNLAARNARRK